MRIALASMGNPLSVGTWSGIPAHIIFALQQQNHEVIPIWLHHPKEPWYYNWKRRIYFRLQKRWFLASVEESVLEQIGEQFDAEVEKHNPNVVIVIHGDFLACTSFKHPVCIIHDTTFATLVNYYSDFSNLTKRSIIAGNKMYQKALNYAKAAVFSSDWASRSAIEDYKTSSNKIFTIPFGANLTNIPKDEEVNSWIIQRSKISCCNFLFLGVDWTRKGGPDAVRFIKTLNKKGIRSKLVVVGCNATVAAEDEQFLEQVGFLRKDIESENKTLKNLFVECTALLVPSLAECYGCVYCEANAYGLPAIGRDTGGVSEIIKDGMNGLLLKDDETPEKLAIRWLSIWTSEDSYISMGLNCRKEYNERLNYNVFAKKLEHVLQAISNN